MEDNKLAKGLYAFMPHEKAPDFINMELSIKPDHFKAWLENQPTDDNGFVKVTIKTSKQGKMYAERNDWKPMKETVSEDSNDLPF